jgi:hypothetical protein
MRHFFRDNSGPVSGVTELKVLSVSPSVAFSIVSGILERLVQWEAAYLLGWMAPDVVDAWW